MIEIFLVVLAFVWIAFAVMSDLKTSEIPNWVNFSLIIFALGVRLFYDLFTLSSFSTKSLYVILLVILVPLLSLFYFTTYFKTIKRETIVLLSISILFAILIYLNYTNDFLKEIILESGFVYSYQGIFGLMVFFLVANLLYHVRFFAGGDTKLMMALGPILPLSAGFLSNIDLFFSFMFLFLMTGVAFGMACVIYFSFRDFSKLKKDFVKHVKMNKKFFYTFMILGMVFMVVGFVEELLFLLGILVFILPYLYFYTKTIDNNSLVKRVNTKELTEGDWLYRDVKVGKKFVRANWEGLSKKEIFLIRKKYAFVMIKRGIEFSPVFLISFVLFVYFYLNGINLWNSLW